MSLRNESDRFGTEPLGPGFQVSPFREHSARAAGDTWPTNKKNALCDAMSLATQTADAATFQRWLHARQYPADCAATVGAQTRQDYFYALGLGAQMVALKFNFVHALLEGMVYHLDRKSVV